MNLSDGIGWAKKILRVFPALTKEEQTVFEFIHKHVPLITELDDVFEKINRISALLKNKGVSRPAVRTCLKEIKPLLASSNAGVVNIAEDIKSYLEEEGGKLKSGKSVWHASSDIIESMFGNYKNRKSANPPDGVTRFVMMLPLLTKVDTESGRSNIS